MIPITVVETLTRYVPKPKDVRLEAVRSSFYDGWEFRAIRRDGDKFRTARSCLNATELMGGFRPDSEIAALFIGRASLAVYILCPPRPAFRIGTRHRKRLQFAREAWR